METILSNCCKQLLDLRNAQLSEEYYYSSLPLCVIDAVFSIGIRYSTTRRVVINFCNRQKIKRLREYGSLYPDKKQQFSIREFLSLYENYSIEELANNFFKNRCRTSSRNGILKTEAVFKFSEVLYKYEINFFQDLPDFIGNKEFEYSIKQIPGQKSGISTSYFYMLAGEENFIKPDRMIIRFIESCIGKSINIHEATELLKEAYKTLKSNFPNLTLRQLDHEIWKYQKNAPLS
ncbi:hypothetical protein [Myxosarcina sp. GI1]|uniref:hypothetical protein n=1 Tax=Myxosarcina sp. GI1 TaxID=1541065 RepID=UPI00055B08D3|nr:hypothetical protein [Myxosarcina sp. GI1]